MKINKITSSLFQRVRKALCRPSPLAFIEIDGVVLPKLIEKQTDEGNKEKNQKKKQDD